MWDTLIAQTTQPEVTGDQWTPANVITIVGVLVAAALSIITAMQQRKTDRKVVETDKKAEVAGVLAAKTETTAEANTKSLDQLTDGLRTTNQSVTQVALSVPPPMTNGNGTEDKHPC